MINYSTNSNIRQNLIFILAFLSIASVALLNTLFSSLKIPIPPEWKAFGSTPSAFGIFGIYFWIFDSFLWKIPFLQRIHHIPNLNGDWKGRITKLNSDNTDIYSNVNAIIQQTWSKIQIEVTSDHTSSCIFSISIDLSSEKRKNIDYIYRVKPTKERTKGDNDRSEGYQNLILENSNLLAGLYFSSKLKIGTLTLERLKCF